MPRRPHRRKLAAAVGAVMLLAGSLAFAAVTKKVQRAFQGKILITADTLPDGNVDDDGGTIKRYKSLDLTSIKHDEDGGIATWTFNYTAFFRKPIGVSQVSLDFHKVDKAKSYVANKRFGVDPKLTILSGRLTITEDDGPAAGQTYELVLRGKRGKKEVDLAKTRLKLE